MRPELYQCVFCIYGDNHIIFLLYSAKQWITCIDFQIEKWIYQQMMIKLLRIDREHLKSEGVCLFLVRVGVGQRIYLLKLKIWKIHNLCSREYEQTHQSCQRQGARLSHFCFLPDKFLASQEITGEEPMKRKIKVPVPQGETTLQYTSHFLNENL